MAKQLDASPKTITLCIIDDPDNPGTLIKRVEVTGKVSDPAGSNNLDKRSKGVPASMTYTASDWTAIEAAADVALKAEGGV